MAVKIHTGEWVCAICGAKHLTAARADGCRDSHQMLYIPMSKTELNRLLHAIMLDDFSLVPNHLLETLKRYARFQSTIDNTTER